MKFKNYSIFLLLFSITVFSQEQKMNLNNNEKYIAQKLNNIQVVFDSDSISGFNEDAARKQAAMSSAPKWEQILFISHLKRNYINYKYNLVKRTFPKAVLTPTGCANADFENGTTSNWIITEGTNTNSSTMGGCCPTAAASARYALVGPGTDPVITPLATNAAGTGNYVLRLGEVDVYSPATAVRASYSFIVDNASSNFVYRYAAVFEDAGHVCDEQPYMNISFTNGAGNPIPCGAYFANPVSASCNTNIDGSTIDFSIQSCQQVLPPPFPPICTTKSYKYKNWTTRSFDLTAYVGQQVTVEFTIADCTNTGHSGWAYIDASCQPFTLNLNGNEIPIGQTNNSFCGSTTTNTLCAPPGFSYSWTGPGVTGQTGQCVNPTVAGSYSVTLGIAGSVCPFSPVLYSDFVTSPSPTITASLTQPVCSSPVGSATVNVVSGTAPYTYSWSPSVAAPTSTTNTNLSFGATYTVSVLDDLGCLASTTFSIDNFSGAPQYTISSNPGLALSCASPNVTLTLGSTNPNTSVNWEGPLGTISGSTTVVNSAGVYSYTVTNTVSTCSLTGTMNVTGSVNLPVLTSTLTQLSCTSSVGSATVDASGGLAPYTYSWSPVVAAPTSTTNSNLSPGSYTVLVTDDAGCTGGTTFSINNFAGLPSYTLGSSPTLSLNCSVPNTTLTFVPTNTNTSTSWEGPSGNISGTSTIANGAGVYTYTAINTISTCSVTGTFTVISDKVTPTATYTVSCNTNTVTLDATASSVDINLNWTVPTTPPTTFGNPVSSTTIGIYTLTATNPINGCIQTYTAAAAVPPINVVTSPSSNLITCTTKTIQATTTPTTGVIITWSDGITTSTVNTIPITTSGTYTTVVQVPNGCSSQSVITVSTNTSVNVSITPSSTIIPCSTGTVALVANSTVGGPYTYTWNPSSITGPTYTVSNAGTYSVVALNTANGCTATVSQYIDAESVNASFVADPYQGYMPLPVTFTNTSSNPVGTNYTWNFGDGNGLASNSPTVSTIYNTQGNFPVVLTATNGFCQDTAVRYIKVDLISLFTVPNVFTPNGDGKNDVFTFNAINMGEITLTVFDRWGLKMFEATDIGNIKWDGKNKGGSLVTDGTYFYIIKAVGLDDVKYDLQGTISVFQ